MKFLVLFLLIPFLTAADQPAKHRMEPMMRSANFEITAPTLGFGFDANEEPTFFIFHEKTGYEPATARSVRGLFDKLLGKLGKELCAARVRPDFVTVSSGVVNVQWDITNVCSGRDNPVRNPRRIEDRGTE